MVHEVFDTPALLMTLVSQRALACLLLLVMGMSVRAKGEVVLISPGSYFPEIAIPTPWKIFLFYMAGRWQSRGKLLHTVLLTSGPATALHLSSSSRMN